MTTSILTTKLYIPPRRPNAVPRPRLIDRLSQGANGKLSLITAPAGFGKTTLVTEWLAQLPEGDRQIAWISLDESDSDPVHFLIYVIAAVQTQRPEFGQLSLASLTTPPSPNFEIIAHDLLNEWAQNSRPLLLVLDDYHAITDEATHRILNTLIDYAPPHLHFVITSRDTPPLALPRWQVRGQLTEVQAGDLRFTPLETQHFLRGTMGLSLDEQAVVALETRTEGWVAGLQLAAISLRGTQNADIFIDAFTGRDRRVADYLLSEVLERQSPEIQQFLLRTSILDRFNASLCDALLGRAQPQFQAQQFLEALEATDLFIVPLDNERYWYRYHHLFAQLLRQRLQNALTAKEIARLHLRAAKWYEAHQRYDEAIPQALQAADFEYAARLIPQIPLERLWEQNIGSLLQRWTEKLPDAAINKYPKAAVWIMLAHLLRGEIETIQYYLALVEKNPTVEAECKIFTSVLARNEGDLGRALRLVQAAAANLPEEEMPLKVMAFSQVANCQLELGKLAEAEATLQNLRQWLPSGKPALLNMQLEAIDLQGGIAKVRGDFYQAEIFFKESLALVERMGGVTPQIGMTYFHLGSLHYQWNELDTAETYYKKAAAWGERAGTIDLALNTSLGLAALACARGEEEAARAAVGQFLALTRQVTLPAVRAISRAVEADYELWFGNLNAAVRWANASGLTVNDQPNFSQLREYPIFILVRLAESRELGELSEVPNIITFLDGFIAQAQAVSHTHYLIRGFILKALALDLLGETKEAVRALHAALELAQPGSILRVFLDRGAPMQQLLEKALSYGKRLVFIRRLLVAFAEGAAARGEEPRKSAPPTSLPEALTNREFEILQLIVAGLSNKAIQEKLVISNNTVRTHIRNLYGKLGVNNRTQAVLRARELGLL